MQNIEAMYITGMVGDGCGFKVMRVRLHQRERDVDLMWCLPFFFTFSYALVSLVSFIFLISRALLLVRFVPIREHWHFLVFPFGRRVVGCLAGEKEPWSR